MRAYGKSCAFLTVLLLLSLALLLAACGGGNEEDTPTRAPSGGFGPGVTDTEILLGAHAPLAGALGAVYAMIPNATSAYFNYVNDTQGGVCGRKIVYKVEDDNYDPAKGLEVTRKLVEQDKVLALVGNLGDLDHSSAFEYLNEVGVPDLLVSGGAHKYGSDPQGHPWTVQMIPDYRVEATFFAQYISENLPGKKVAVLYENDDFGIDGLAGLKDALDPAKNEVATEQPYEASAIDIRSQVTNMKDSGAEVAVFYTTPGVTGQAIKAADRMGWKPQYLVTYVNSDDILFQFVPAPLLDGMITFNILKLAAWRDDDPAVAKHYEIMNKYGGPVPSNFSIYAQALGELMVEVLGRACDNLTRQGLMDAIESIDGWHSDLLLDGINVTISDTDHTAFNNGRVLKVVVENGKGRFEYVGPVYEFRQ